jgi:hypothetical protein
MNSSSAERLVKRLPGLAASAAAIASAVVAVAAPAPTPTPAAIAAIDLAKPFATRSAWRFTAAQGPEIDDPAGLAGDKAPGAILLCLRKDASGPCDPQLQGTLRAGSGDDVFAAPHYLNQAKVVHGAAGRPLLLVQTASVHSGDGDQLVFTQVLAYRRDTDQFVRVYGHPTGRNNNQEVRFIAAGPLKGDIIAAEPTEKAPFGFWISVSLLASAGTYKEVLRFRSATRYGDGNPLAVIDSEMPNIEQQLGFWRPGLPLPLPAGACPKPHLKDTALWCS